MTRREFNKNLLMASAGTLCEENGVTVLFAGDTLLGGYYGSPEYGTNTDLVSKIDSFTSQEAAAHFFHNVLPFFQEADIRVLNLEGPITPRLQREELTRKMRRKLFPLRQHERAAEILRSVGVDIVSLANNHSCDYNGAEGLEYTLNQLGNIRAIGVGRGDEAYAAHRRTVKGIRLSFMALTNIFSPPDIPTRYSYGVAGVRSATIGHALNYVNAERKWADFLFLFLHAGPKRGRVVLPEQQNIIDSLLRSGVDVVVGSHSHCRQKIEMRGAQTAFYGIGNLVFGGYRATQNPSLIPLITVNPAMPPLIKYIPIRPSRNGSYTPEVQA